jgi:hypothetical protein
MVNREWNKENGKRGGKKEEEEKLRKMIVKAK